MDYHRFRFVKKTGTYADALAALGLADLLFRLAGCEVRVRDEGGEFVAYPVRPVRLEDLDTEMLRRNPGYPYVKLESGDPAAPCDAIDYQAERRRLLAYRELREAAAGVDQEQLRQAEPRSDWYLIQNLNVLQALKGYNGLHIAIRQAEPGAFRRSVVAKLEALATSGDAAMADTPFTPSVSPLQAFNPAVGKGVNRIKPDGAPIRELPARFLDWFEEWLRYIGVHVASNAYSMGDDIKFVSLVPADAEVTFTREVIRPSFLRLRLRGSIQIDVLGALGVAEELIRRSGMLEGRTASILFRRTPRQVVAGLQTAYFSSLGSARALSNTSFIGLPGWFPVTSREDAEAWLDILAEHQDCLRLLDETWNEEAALLQRYRNFLSGNGLVDLLEFLAAYAAHVIRTREQGRPVRQFTVLNLRRLVVSMDKRLTPILESEAFRNVAAAVRRATVNEQYMKAKGQDVFDVHYGLVQELRRKARFRDQFVAVLCDFAASYNSENARREEQLKGGAGRRRPALTTSDLQEFIRLVDDYGSELVAMLLVAYGTARELREAEPDDLATASA